MKFAEMPYRRPDPDAIREKYENLTNSFTAAESADEQYRLILEHEKVFAGFSSMSQIAYIRNSINTTDPYYEGEMAFIDSVTPVVTELMHGFLRAVVGSPFRAELEKRTGKNFFSVLELSLKSSSPETVELQKRENALVTEYEKLLASAQIPFRGEVLNLSEIQKHTVSADSSARREAWEKTGGFFEENRRRLDEIYSELIRNRTEQADRLGYKNYVQLGYDRLGRSCYGPDEVKAYREQIVRDLVPFVSELKRRQAKRLGLPDIKFWDNDILYPEGNPAPRGSEQELVAAAGKMYREMSPLTGEFFDFMTENGLFDLESKKGKAGGGYCTEIPDYKSPFIFANFNGTAGDVEVLTHEAGHAFAAYLAGSMDLLELTCPTMDGAETHSMSMELFSRPWDGLFFGGEADRFRAYQLESALDFIPYGCLVDHFQTIMYEHTELTPDERRQVWLELEHVYRPWIDFADLPYFAVGGGYQRQHHIYSFPLYYIDYCLAQTAALEFWAASEKDWKEAFGRYLTFVKAGGTKTFTELVKLGGLESPFRSGCIRGICGQVDKALASD